MRRDDGLLRLDAGDLVVALNQFEPYKPRDWSPESRRIVLGLLKRAQHRLEVTVNKWEGAIVETIDIEAQDLSEDDKVFFRKQNQEHRVVKVLQSPNDPDYVFVYFEGEWKIEAEKIEKFEVVA